jgi:AGCS family alanine or glycine:cation symporter
MPFRVLFSLVVFIGCTVQLGVVWAFSDVMNGLMALPNLIGLLVLSGLVARETKKYLDNDPKLRATTDEVNAFMAGDKDFEAWKTQAITLPKRN